MNNKMNLKKAREKGKIEDFIAVVNIILIMRPFDFRISDAAGVPIARDIHARRNVSEKRL